MLQLYLLIVGITILILFLTRNKRPRNFPKGPTPLPIVGNLFQGGRELHRVFMKIGKKYGGIFAFDLGPLQTVVITDVKIMRQVLAKSAFAGRPKMQAFIDRCGGKYCRGIIMSELSHWNEQRRFVLKNLREFAFAKCSVPDIILEEVTEFMETLRKASGKPIKSDHLFNVPILNSIWRILTGMRTFQSNPKIIEVTEVVASSLVGKSVHAAMSFAFPKLCKMFPNLTGYNSLLKFSEPLTNFVKEAFLDHKAVFVPGQARDIMDSMCEEIANTTDPNSSFYKEEGELNAMKSLEDLFVGGADTTGTTMNWIFLLLALYPEHQDRIFKELQDVVGSSRSPDLNNRHDMVVTESVIMEGLRFSGIFALSILRSTTEEVSVNGYVLPKDTVIVTDLFAVLHDEDIWGDPESFRPDRFVLPDGSLNKSPEAFLPFSFGKRICIAEKLAREVLFLFTTSILQKFRVSLHGPKPSMKCTTNIVLSPQSHHLVFEERDL